jgi:hypothetical protein
MFPSGLKLTELTGQLCPLSIAKILLIFKSQIIMVLSWLPLANLLPSGLKLTEKTELLCP